MRTYEISRGTMRAVQFAALELKLYALIERLERGSWLERRYAPDQPRVPAGNSDGGQWTDGGVGAGQRQRDGAVRTVADLTQFGTLKQIVSAKTTNLILCIYDFGDGFYSLESDRATGCWPMIHQSGILSIFGGRGSRLNDNVRPAP